MFRTRKTTLAYHRTDSYRIANDDVDHCPFCALDERKIYEDTKTMRVMANKFPYEFWDGRKVAEHLLLAPKRHVLSLDDLTDDEKVDALHLMAEYESKGYNVYWRSQTNQTRSVPHQHTHLIKLKDGDTHFLMYLRRPYLLWKF
jgi:ATP adenylyltransferase